MKTFTLGALDEAGNNLTEEKFHGNNWVILGGAYNRKMWSDTSKIQAKLRLFYRTSEGHLAGAPEDKGLRSSEFDNVRPALFISEKVGPINICLGDEMRIDMSDGRSESFFKNRIFLTGTKKFGNASISVGYVRESNMKGGDWVDHNVLVTRLGITM
jgi:hypothetical protein